MTFARSIDFLIRNGATCAHSSRNDTTYYVAHGIRLGPQAAGSMSLTNGSGTWSTLARWCGRYLPYLRRGAWPFQEFLEILLVICMPLQIRGSRNFRGNMQVPAETLQNAEAETPGILPAVASQLASARGR